MVAQYSTEEKITYWTFDVCFGNNLLGFTLKIVKIIKAVYKKRPGEYKWVIGI